MYFKEQIDQQSWDKINKPRAQTFCFTTSSDTWFWRAHKVKLDIFNSFRCNITDDAVKSLCESLKSCSSLKSIALNFAEYIYDRNIYLLIVYRSNDISDQAIRCLTETLKGLSSLKKITMNFYKSKQFYLVILISYCSCEELSDNGVRSLGEGLKSLIPLERINLNFGS